MSALDQFDAADKATPYAAPVVATKGNVLDQFDAASKAADASVPQPKSTSTAALGSDWQNFAAGAGKAVTDLGRGAKQIMDIPAQYLESKFPGLSAWGQSIGLPSAAASATATNADVAESRATDAPLMNTKAGIGGNIAGNIATTMLPLSIAARGGNVMNGANAAKSLLNPATYKAAATMGGISGALQPVAGNDSRLANMGIGAAAGTLGNAAVNTIGRVAQPVANVLTNARDKAVSVLENAGIPLDAAQKSGSAFLGRIRSGLSDNPFTNGAQKDLSAVQQAGYTKAVLGTMGENSTAATSDVMNAGATRINGVFSDVLNRNDIKIGDDTLSKIASIQQAANEEEKAPVASIANRLIGSVQDDGTVPGQTAYNIKKDLDRLADSPDTTLGYHAKQLRSTLMDTINDSLSPTDQAAFSEARTQFSNMKNIEKTIDKEGNGDISPARLASVMAQKRNIGASIYGRGNQSLVDLAHSGNMLLPDKLPQSGSIPRMAMQMALPLAAGGAQAAYTGDFESALRTTAGLYALPKAAQYLINNPTTSNYLARGMTGSMTPIRDLLQSPQTSPLIGGVMRRLPEAFKFADR